jgi:hypothetical protein
MGTRVLFLVTGVAAWLGGLTTFAVSSCAVEACAMDSDGFGCKREPPTSAPRELGDAVKASTPSPPVSGTTMSAMNASAMNVATTTAKPSGSFLAAELPGDVEYSKDVRKTVVGDIEQASASAKVGDAALSITASILPGFVIAVATDDILYRKARNELLKTFSAHSTSWGSCTHAGFACRKLLYEADDGRKGMARLYLHDAVLVVINATYDEDEDVARRFLASAH